MKKITVGFSSAIILTLSSPLSAHVGEHGVLTDHGYLLALLGVVAGGLILKRLMSHTTRL